MVNFDCLKNYRLGSISACCESLQIRVISLEMRPLVALYPSPIRNILFKATILSFGLDLRTQGRYAHAYGICATFYCISLNNIYIYICWGQIARYIAQIWLWWKHMTIFLCTIIVNWYVLVRLLKIFLGIMFGLVF